MVDHARGEPRPSLSEAAAIDGARSLAVVDVQAGATVWSVTFAPPEALARPATPDRYADDRDGADRDGIEPVRIADDVLDTVRGADRLASPPGVTGGWSEVILIDESHYHLLRPLGAAADALVVELVLDARSANLAAARQTFAALVSAYDAPSQARPDHPADPVDESEHPVAASQHPVGAAGLPRRVAAAPPGTVGPDPARLVDEPILDRVAEALRTLT